MLKHQPFQTKILHSPSSWAKSSASPARCVFEVYHRKNGKSFKNIKHNYFPSFKTAWNNIFIPLSSFSRFVSFVCCCAKEKFNMKMKIKTMENFPSNILKEIFFHSTTDFSVTPSEVCFWLILYPDTFLQQMTYAVQPEVNASPGQ